MKIKFLGLEGQDEITLRGVTFVKDESVEVDGSIAAKVAALPYFREVKRGRPKKNAEDK